MYYFGVDEAGRGPVFGNMYIACVVAHPKDIPDTVADSKTLSNKRIEELANKMLNSPKINFAIYQVSPDEIDNSEKSISGLTLEGFAKTIEKTEPATIGFVDACLKDTSYIESHLREAVEKPIFVEAEHKADEKYPIVSAASILAKNARENHIAQLKKEYGEIGSGYPSDSTTQEYLIDYISTHNELPPFARESWATSQKALEKYA